MNHRPTRSRARNEARSRLIRSRARSEARRRPTRSTARSDATSREKYISVEIISTGHTNFLVEVELTWVQDPGSSPKSL